MNEPAKIKTSARRKARRLVIQAIYQMQFNTGSIDEIKQQLLKNANPKKVDIEYFSALLFGINNHLDEINNNITPHLDRKITDINPVELAILRLATYELIYRLDIPYKVVINEALEITKIFGATDSSKFINSILDKAAKAVRQKKEEKNAT